MHSTGAFPPDSLGRVVFVIIHGNDKRVIEIFKNKTKLSG